MVIRCCWW